MKLFSSLLASGLLTAGLLVAFADVAAAKNDNKTTTTSTSSGSSSTTSSTSSGSSSTTSTSPGNSSKNSTSASPSGSSTSSGSSSTTSSSTTSSSTSSGSSSTTPSTPTTSSTTSSTPTTSSSPQCTSAGFAFTSCIGGFDLAGGENDVTDGAADNLASKQLATGIFGGITDWLFNSKINVGGGETTGAGKGDVLGFDLSYSADATTGKFSFGNIDLANTNLAVSMKSARSYSMFYFKAGSLSSSSILWDMLGVSTNNKGTAQALSHASVYYNFVPPPKVETPVVQSPVGEAPKAEVPKVVEPVFQPPVEEPKVEEPKAEEPKVEEPKVEAPKTEEPKTEAPKPTLPPVQVVLSSEQPEAPREVPEPASLLGLATVVGLGTQLKRKLDKK